MKTTLPGLSMNRNVFQISLLLMLLFVARCTIAQSYLPNYSFTPTITTYTPITSGTVLGTGAIDDVDYFANNIGFPFNYNGTIYTTFSVNTNGVLAFGSSYTYGSINNQGALSDYYSSNNVASALNADLQGTSIAELRYDIIGTAPFRKLVVQWSNFAYWNSLGVLPGDTENFQIVLTETSNTIEFNYGIFTKDMSDRYTQVGIRGDSYYDFLNRETSTDWAATAAGYSQYNTCLLSSANGSVLPYDGLTFKYSPPSLSYISSEASTASSETIAPGSSNQRMLGFKINAYGMSGILPISEIVVSTAGSTNTADIANLKVFYTGSSNIFSTNQQFGATLATPGATNTVSDSLNLSEGDNYFWVTYDLAPGATLGNIVDAAITTVKVKNVNEVPSVTSPAGSRQIAAPMSYISSETFQASVQKIGRGENNNKIIGLNIVTSSIGAPVNVNQIDFNAAGITDTANVRNMKVWYTGNSKDFETVTQFGNTLNFLPGTLTFSVTGDQEIMNDTNYFWLTYDIDPSALLGNLIDGECNSFLIGAVSQVPSISSPIGSREVRDGYCAPLLSQAATTCNDGYYISSVYSYGAESDLNNMYSGCNGNPVNNYINYENKTLIVKQGQTFSLNFGDYNTYLTYAAWIDYNQDGIFDNVTERVHQSSGWGNYGADGTSVTVPCSVAAGQTRMRVRGTNFYNFYSPISDPCSDIYTGETEDYNVIILENPITYDYSQATQDPGIVAPGKMDYPVMRIEVGASHCGIPTASSFTFSTTGTTNTSEIATAKLYKTGTDAGFNTSNLIGTIVSPNGQFTFPVSDTLIADRIIYYWLAYDVTGTAIIGNVLDATFDSVEVLGAYHTPDVTDPSGNITVTAPITYMGSEASQATIDKIGSGTSDNEIIKLAVEMSPTGAPASLSQIDFTISGSSVPADVLKMKIWYTGNDDEFNTYQQFGSDIAGVPGTSSYTALGSQDLNPGLNYFWISYDIDSLAIPGNVIDGECNTIIVSGTSQIPSVTVPLGNREIRAEFCTPLVSQAASSCNWYFINAVYTYGADVNIDNQYSYCNGDPINNHAYFKNQTMVTHKSRWITINLGNYWDYLTYTVWIDYNQDGIFDNLTERVFMAPGAGNYGFLSGSFQIPCTALTGKTRMRVRAGDYWSTAGGSWITDPCADVIYGETEDYNVMILETPLEYNLYAEQQSDIVAPGSTDRVVMKLPIYSTGCGAPALTEFRFSTSGTTNPADIVSAKLYKTGTAGSFGTSNLLGTASTPSGQFVIAVTDTLDLDDVSYYWLAYDVSGTATVSNTLDATLDSIAVSGGYFIPNVGSPSENLTVVAPMTYVSSDVIQVPGKIAKGSLDNPVLGLTVTTSSTGAPVTATQINFNLIGSTVPDNVVSMKIWYTGSSNEFGTKFQFGNTVPLVSGTTSYSVTGSQDLVNDANYFWIAFDIDTAAIVGNQIDGECTSVTIDGTAHIPSVTAPAGSLEIRQEYCTPIISNGSFTCNWGYYINSVYTNGAVSDLNNQYSGCNGDPVNNYVHFNSPSLVVNQNQSFDITLGDYQSYLTYTVWIDFNQDGVYDNATERVFQSPYTGNYAYVFGTIDIPCSAMPGQTRMRIRGANYWWANAFINDPCSDVGFGETEDYNITILASPVTYDFSSTEQQTGIVAPATTDIPVLRATVGIAQCGDAVTTEFKFSTSGTTNVSDIIAAKLYRTGSSPDFNTTTLLGTVASPSGQFSFTVSDTLVSDGKTTYWLAYDVNGSATLGNSLDATFDSVEVFGTFQIPSDGNPTGNITISAPMTYLSSDVVQTSVQKLGRGTENNTILGMKVATSSTGAAVYLTQFDLNTNGTTDTANIRNIKVWYTGNSNQFATTTQFGSTMAYLSGSTTFNITGSQGLMNDTNYFWLTYDIDAGSTLANLVDAECVSMTIGGTPQIPSTTAPAGEREIRADYCPPIVSQVANTCNYGYYLNSVYTYGAIGNISNTNSGCNGDPVNNYIYYPNQTLVMAQNQSFTMNIGDYSRYLTYAVWIDYNQDGVFDNATERVLQPPGTGNYGYISGTVTIPCSALPGQTRMRVRGGDFYWFYSYINDACGDVGYGETEDYNVMIQENPVVYDYSTTLQQTGIVAPGATDLPILRVEVGASQCGDPTVTTFTFSTAGSTNSSDIASAKLYKTGGFSDFNTSVLVGTVASPSGQFSFATTDTLIANGTSYYWLTYDVSASATLSNVLDATFDSVEVLGGYHTPYETAPAGEITILAPMTYISSEVTQTMVQKIGVGSSDNQILGVKLVASSTGAPIQVTQLDINISGTTTLSDVSNMKVWYTGGSNQFARTTQFGSTVPYLSGSINYSVTGNQNLMNDTNYFWISYDIDTAALVGNFIDGECTSILINGTPQTPSVTAPAGNREVRLEYCAPIVSQTANSCNYGYYISSIATNRAVTNLSNYYSGCNGNPVNNYIHYTDRTLVVNQNQAFDIYIGDYNTYMTYAVWIDYNQDGIFDNVTERVFQSPYTGNYGYVNGVITVPQTAPAGQTRMRVRGGDYYWFYSFINDPCSDVGYGETEDYDIMILPEPPPATYVWNRTNPEDFTASYNWTPDRVNPLMNDQLVFNGGGQISVYNVNPQKVSSITVDNGTEVSLESYYTVTLTATDTLALTSGKIKTNSSLALSVGSDVSHIGTITGTGSVEGILKRWINPATTSYDFPFSYNGNSNGVNLTYTTPPASGGSITARYIWGEPGQLGLPLVDGAINVTKASNFGVWKLKGGDGLSGGTYTGTYTAGGIVDVTLASDLVVLRRLVGIAQWSIHGTSVTTTGTTTAPVLSRTGMTLLGEFGVGGDSTVNPLPVKLISFKANAMKGDVITSWTTASEINNAGFEVQRSVDGKTFTKIGFVKGKGNSNSVVNYSDLDRDAFKKAGVNTLYYRLRQLDMDGKEWISQVASVTNNDNKLSSVHAYPNPFTNKVTIDVVSAEDAAYNLSIMDIQGRVVYASDLRIMKGVNNIPVDRLEELKSGVYFIRVSGPETKTIKLIKTNQE
jgi:hypothetical protein